MSSNTPQNGDSSDSVPYSAEDVQVLSGLEHIRRRPGMYVGYCDVRGLHHLVYELLGNALNEAVAGHCRHIDVELLACGGCRVGDDGRGLPVERMKDGRNLFEALLTRVGAGPKFDPRSYHVELGLRGMGLCVVNALSTNLVVEVWRDGRFWRKWFQRGSACHALHSVRISSGRTGSRIAFWPDREIFREGPRFEYETLSDRLRELAALHKGVALTLADHRGEEPRTQAFHFPAGLADYFRHVATGRSPVHPHMIHFRGERDGCGFEVAMQWTDGPGEVFHSFVNGEQTVGGSHVAGLRGAVVAALRGRAAKALPRKSHRLLAEDIRNGLVAILSVTTPEPRYEGSTKERLGNPEVQTIVSEEAACLLAAFLDGRPEDAAAIVNRIVAAYNARLQGNHA